MVKLPNLQHTPLVKPSKSTNDLSGPQNETTNIRHSAPNLQQTNNNNVQLTKSQIREQKKLEKKRLGEQKKRDRLAAQEQKKRDKAAQEQLKKDKLAAQQQAKRDKLAAQEQQKKDKKAAQEQQKQDKLAAQEQQKQEKLRKKAEKKGQAGTSQDRSQPKVRPNPVKQAPVPLPMPGPTNPLTQRPAGYSTNTLESSISKISGPPPYSATEGIQIARDNTENITLAQPAGETGSWDMVSQHRQQLHRPANVGKTATKQKHLDLNYNIHKSNVSQDNSEA